MILELLTSDRSHRPWAVEEIVREIGDRVTAIDGIERLHRTGLIHRLDGFVFASRAALGAEKTTI